MKHVKIPLSAVLLLPLLAAFSMPGDPIAFRVAKDTSLTKSFELKSELSLDHMSMSMNGTDMSGMIGSMEMKVVSSETTTVKDTYLEMGDGRPTKLRREYQALASQTNVSVKADNPGIPSNDTDMGGKSDLEGKRVVFTAAKEGDGYDVAFDEDSKGDDELLEDLWEDMDLRALLPDGAKAKGDEWEVDLQRMKNVLSPGGNLKVLPESAEVDSMMGAPQGSLSDMLGELEGKVTASYSGDEDEAGAKLAVIKLKFKVKSAKDMTELTKKGMEKLKEKMEGVEIDIESADAEFTLEGEGELRWDVSAGHMRSLEISGNMTMSMEQSMKMNMGGQNMAQKISMELSGSFSQGASVER